MEAVMKSWFRGGTKVQPQPKPRDPGRFKLLPQCVKPTDTVASHPATSARDPYGGRDTERDFLIRYCDPFGRRVMVNHIIDAPDAPFAGFKQSGLGREFGHDGMRTSPVETLRSVLSEVSGGT
jgi:hypothetical protein